MVRQRNGSANQRPKPSRLVGRLDGDVSITVSSGKPLTQDVIQKVIDHLRREAKKLPEKGDAALAPLQVS